MFTKMLGTLAGLMGAAGVVLSALAAHVNAGLQNAASILLVHALAILAVLAWSTRGPLWPPLARLSLGGFVIGSLLFSGDVTMFVLRAGHLFPMAAPTGGTLLIAAWLALAASAIAGREQP